MDAEFSRSLLDNMTLSLSKIDRLKANLIDSPYGPANKFTRRWMRLLANDDEVTTLLSFLDWMTYATEKGLETVRRHQDED